MKCILPVVGSRWNSELFKESNSTDLKKMVSVASAPSRTHVNSTSAIGSSI